MRCCSRIMVSPPGLLVFGAFMFLSAGGIQEDADAAVCQAPDGAEDSVTAETSSPFALLQKTTRVRRRGLSSVVPAAPSVLVAFARLQFGAAARRMEADHSGALVDADQRGSLALAETEAASPPTHGPGEEWTIPHWRALTHMNPHEMLRKLSVQNLFLPVMFGFVCLVLLLFSMVDCCGGSRKEDEVARSGELRPWSIGGILCLTSYKFYTGFLSSTWMPFLLAMEGQQLMGERQSFFMGTAKLIYGFSIILNPVFGLLGDHVAVSSRWSGRRLFVLVGVGCSGLGVYGCLVGAQVGSVYGYFLGTILWMIGEALADVTTEALVPELLPPHQYAISSSLRGLNFLLGGLTGYAMLIVLREMHYSWLYYGYLICMVLCALLSLCFITTEDLQQRTPTQMPNEISLTAVLTQAYVVPATYAGGFPRACMCLFCFSLGSAPMFFLLLMIRDLVNIHDENKLQWHFGFISGVFFVAAAVASVILSAAAAEQSSPSGHDEQPEQRIEREAANESAVVWRWKTMFSSTVIFGIVAGAIPLVGVMPTESSRMLTFYLFALVFGFSFGCVYCKFQECTWSILPPNVDVANAMGFAAMCKLAGVGLGNFFAGCLLDAFVVPKQSGHRYMFRGYVCTCGFCAVVVFLSAYLLRNVRDTALAKQRASSCMNLGG